MTRIRLILLPGGGSGGCYGSIAVLIVAAIVVSIPIGILLGLFAGGIDILHMSLVGADQPGEILVKDFTSETPGYEGSAALGVGGTARANIVSPAGGDYYLTIGSKVFTNSGTVQVSINDGPATTVDIGQVANCKNNWFVCSPPVTVQLKQGLNTLHLSNELCSSRCPVVIFVSLIPAQ